MGPMDGSLYVLIGEGKSGKTTLAVDFCDALQIKAVIIAPQMSNPRFFEFDHVVDHGQDFQDAYDKSIGHLLVKVTEARSDLFKRLEGFPVVLFDEITLLIDNSKCEEAFKKFARNIRSRDQKVFVTTHRLKDDLPPVVRGEVARKLIQVGPLFDTQKQHDLYDAGNIAGHITFKGFAESLERMKPYSWKEKNKDGWYLFKNT